MKDICDKCHEEFGLNRSSDKWDRFCGNQKELWNKYSHVLIKRKDKTVNVEPFKIASISHRGGLWGICFYGKGGCYYFKTKKEMMEQFIWLNREKND